MLLDDFSADPDNEHKKQGNPAVKCNAVYKAEASFNGYLTPTEAIDLARCLLQKAQLILEHGIEDAVVHLWNTGSGDRSLHCGLNKAVKKNLESTES